MAKSKIKIELEAQTKEASKNIATLEMHLKNLQERLKRSDIGSESFRVLGNEIKRVTDKIERSTEAFKKMETLDAVAVLGRLGAEIAGLTALFSNFIQKANELNRSQQALRGEAKLMGVTFESLSKVADETKTKFGLSAQVANGFAVEVAKLAVKAGDASKTQVAIAKLLDLAAAKGLSAEEALTAVKQALLGIDEGTDKLFGKNPSVLYEEYAKAIGTTAGKLTDQQKAQAILIATISEGNKVEGERLKYLQSAAGAQERYKQSIDELTASIGQELLKVLKPMLNFLNEGLKLLNQLDSNTVAATLAFVSFGYAIYQIVTALQAFRVAMTMATGGIYALLAAIGGGLTAAFIVMQAGSDEAEKSLKELESRVNKNAQSFNSLANQMNATAAASSDMVDELKKLNDEYDKLLKEQAEPKSISEYRKAIQEQFDVIAKEREKLERKLGGESIASVLNRRDVLARTVAEKQSVADLSAEQKALTELNVLLKNYEEANTRLLILQKKLEIFRLKNKSEGGTQRRLSEAKLPAPLPMSPALPAFSSDILNIRAINEEEFRRIQNQKQYNRYQSGMLQRVDVAGQQRDMTELTLLRRINEERMKGAKLRGDAKEFEDALAVIERIDEKVREIDATLSESAKRYVGILGSGLSQVADAFGAQVVAGLWNESFSIGQMFEGIAKQFIASIVSEFMKQEILSLFGGLFSGGGLLSSLFGFAAGGRPSVGRVSVVGERGAELFKPDVPGRVVGAKEASSQLSSILDLFESPLPSFDIRELSGLLAVQTAETVRLRKVLSAKEFAVDIDGERANSRLKRVSRRIETRVY